MRKIMHFSLSFIVVFFTLFTGSLVAQTHSDKDEPIEQITKHWYSLGKEIRLRTGASKEDFKVFRSFYEQKLDSERTLFLTLFRAGKLSPSNMVEYFKPIENKYINLYRKFAAIVKEYPSSVEEYRHARTHKPLTPCDSSGCNNVDFSNGTLSGWYAYYGSNTSGSTSSFESIGGITGGLCGAVTRAAGPDIATGGTYQVAIMSGAGTDPVVPIPLVSPYGGKYSVRIGDSTNTGQGVGILEQTFYVTAANADFSYQFAPVLEKFAHSPNTRPYFCATLFDQNGDTIPGCSKFVSVAGINDHTLGFDSVYDPSVGLYVCYKPWSFVFVSLKKYIGQCVTMQFVAGDCAWGGHFGYAYVTASCNPLKIVTSSPAVCGGNVTLTAPVGGTTYAWTGPAGGIVGSSTTQSITVDSAGTYNVIITPYNGKACADTLSITLPKAAGPPPVPSFTADTVCLGSPTQFVNTSNPLTGPNVKFYWDFYNIGVINDSTTNPLWPYTHPGVYTVKLYEVNNGCGADTLIKVLVDSNSKASFTFSSTCVGQAVNFTNTSSNANAYSWNFGDPASLANDSSKLQNPSHTYGLPGTYTVTLVASTSGSCRDTDKQVVTVAAAPKPVVSGVDSICSGSSTTLTASGASTYTWSPSATLSASTGTSVIATPPVTTTYTVSGSNGTCLHDTTFTVNVTPPPSGTITAKPDTICVGDSSKLIASGGTSYVWSPGGKTNDSIWVKPASTTTYTLSVTKGKCSTNITQTITVQSALTMSIKLSQDSICPKDSTVLSVTGANTYKWSTGATTSTITVKPSGTSLYWVKATNRCATDSLADTVHVVPIPKPIISGNDSICVGSSTTLTATGGLQYLWTPGAMTGSTIVVSPTTTTFYKVQASNGHCTHDTTFRVVVSPYPVPAIIASADSICPKDSAQLVASGGGTYSWVPGGQTSASIWVKPGSTTTYTVTVTKNGCSSSASQQVALYKIGTSSVSTTIPTTCPGDSTTLYVTGGSSYKWAPGGATTGTIHVKPTSTTTYTVIVQVRCTADTLTQTINVVPFPKITLSGNTNICPGTKTVLTASGGTSYSWNGGATSASGSITVNPFVQTTYTVEVFNGACGKDTTITVTMKPAPVVTITHPGPVCEGNSVTLTATGGGSYMWSNGATTSSITFAASLADSMYYVTVSNGCSTFDSTKLTVLPVSPVVACCNDTIAWGSSVSMTATGATAYVWSPRDSLSCFTCPVTAATPAENTTYTVTGTDANGCTTEAEVTIIIECAKYIIPNVFTPNTEVKNLNDRVFLIKEIPDIPYSIEIFDRWGKQVFTSTNDQQPWNGNINNSGAQCPDGVYYYIIKSTCNGVNREDHGFVQLIR